MPKKKKEKPDKQDIEILIALYYLEGGTLYDLEKVLELPRGTISDRLRWLESKGYLDKPIGDVHKGRFKKIYKRPDREKILQAIMEREAIKSVEDLEIFVGDVVLNTLGYDLADFKEWSQDETGIFDFFPMFVWEYLGLIEIKTGKNFEEFQFKLTERGVKKILQSYKHYAKMFLEDLKSFDEKEYKNFLKSLLKKD